MTLRGRQGPKIKWLALYCFITIKWQRRAFHWIATTCVLKQEDYLLLKSIFAKLPSGFSDGARTEVYQYVKKKNCSASEMNNDSYAAITEM